jgi:hypothetical protein
LQNFFRCGLFYRTGSNGKEKAMHIRKLAVTLVASGILGICPALAAAQTAENPQMARSGNEIRKQVREIRRDRKTLRIERRELRRDRRALRRDLRHQASPAEIKADRSILRQGMQNLRSERRELRRNRRALMRDLRGSRAL